MRTMEAVDVNENVDKVLRYVEKKRKPILVLKNGKGHCMILPVERVEEEATGIVATRTKRVRRDSGQASVG